MTHHPHDHDPQSSSTDANTGGPDADAKSDGEAASGSDLARYREAFREYGIPDHGTLIRGLVEYFEAHDIDEFRPSLTHAELLSRGIREVFIENALLPLIPEALELAIPEAINQTMHRFLSAPISQLPVAMAFFYRELVDAFYRAVAAGAAKDVAILWTSEEPDGGITH